MSKTLSEAARMYPILLHREGELWGYHSPSFGGGGASTRSDALERAQELLSEAVGAYLKDGAVPPSPTNLKDIATDGGEIIWLSVARLR